MAGGRLNQALILPWNWVWPVEFLGRVFFVLFIIGIVKVKVDDGTIGRHADIDTKLLVNAMTLLNGVTCARNRRSQIVAV